MTAVRAHLLVRGLVQGVWYRGSMEDEAHRLAVSGWVRNLPDGAVEAEVEGPREAVDALVAWARRGPQHARVDEVVVTWIPARDEPRGRFAITR